MCWEFDSEGKASLMPSSQLEPQISLSSGNTGSHNTITQFNCTTSHRTLGAWINPSLGMQEACTQLQRTINIYSKRLVTSALSRWEAWTAYFSVFFMMAKYTLPISHHTSKSLRRLQSPATRATLIKLGFNRHTPLVVVFGAVHFGGLAFRDLAVEQGIEQLCLIIRHIRSKPDQGNLLMITLHWWQLVAGISVSLWANPHLSI